MNFLSMSGRRLTVLAGIAAVCLGQNCLCRADYVTVVGLNASSYTGIEGGTINGTVTRSQVFMSGAPRTWYYELPYNVTIALDGVTGHTYPISYQDVGSGWSYSVAYYGTATVTIPASTYSANFSIPFNNNTNLEYDRSATLRVISGSSGGGAIRTAIVVEQDNDWSAAVWVNGYDEILVGGTGGANSTTIRFYRNVQTHAQTINYSLSGDAIAGTDYTPAIGTITIPNGGQIVDVTITATNTAQTATKTLIVQLTSGAYQIDASYPSATVTIIPDYPSVGIYRNNTDMIEGGGSGSFTVFRHPAYTASPAKTVNYAINGTAANGPDYTPTLSRSVTIPAGSAANIITVIPQPDTVVENLEVPETITLDISGNSGYSVNASYPGDTINLWDDTPSVKVYTVLSNSVATNYFGFVVERSFCWQGGNAKQVNLSIGGSATNGVDYTPSLSSSVMIPSGQLSLTNWTRPLTGTNVGPAKTVGVTVLPGSYYVVDGNASNATVTISGYPVIDIEAVEPYASEQGRTGLITVTRSGNTNKTITVQLSVTGSASPGVDYTALPTNLVFTAGQVETNLTLIAIPDAQTELAETVVASLKTNASYFLGLHTNGVVTIDGEGSIASDTYPKSQRYIRGCETNLDACSIVIPLDGIRGTRRGDVELAGTYPTRYHYSATNSGSQSYITNRIPFNTPIVSFGGSWGTPLYIGDSYSVGIHFGFHTLDPIIIYAFRRSDGVFAGMVNFSTPNGNDTGDWTSFATNGFARTTNGYGLTTILRQAPDMKWGTSLPGYALTHIATDAATNYIYMVAVAGYYNGQFMVLDGSQSPAYGYFYELTFEQRPAWRSIFVDQPHFQGTPLPPDLWGKTPEELLNYGAVVTNGVSLAPAACTNLDQSPELRRHPILDQFVADLNHDPLALANYVQNEIELSDPIAYRDDGAVATESVNEGGVNRGALGVYLEGRGSPVEQCALLIYLLRQAGYPATYVFPPEGGVKMLDTRLSALLRIRINDAQDVQGRLYTTNRLITMNYPWVAAYVGNQWVHLFPWIKDTAVEEGLDLYDYLPDPYKETQLWVKDYILGKTNIMAFATLDDDTPGTIFPRWLDDKLKLNAPGISVDDIGMRYINRRHLYAQWQDFPRPTWVTNVSTAMESLTSAAITNVSPALTNIFDTVQVELYSVNNPQKVISTAAMRMADLHNRKFFLTHTNLGNGQIQASLILGAYRPGTPATTGDFSASDTALTNRQALTLTLDGGDDQLKIRLRHRRQRALSWETPLDRIGRFLGLVSEREVSAERPLRKGDLAAICLNAGRVTPAMLRVHAGELWNMEQMLSTNSMAASQVSADVYQGSLVYLMGMNYYERVTRFDTTLRRLFKVEDLSNFSMGLAKISPRRNADGTLVNGAIDPIWPNVDMFFFETVGVGNLSVHPDSGWDAEMATRNYYAVACANQSAQEHAILNKFFGQSNAVSTVKLLQLAQSRAASGGSNVVELSYYNVLSAGEAVYNGKALKNHDPEMWGQVLDFFTDSEFLGFVVGWMPPGTQTNTSGSFSGMGAFVLGLGRSGALIGNNQYGAYANSALTSGTFSESQLAQLGLRVDADGHYTFRTADPTASQRQFAEETPSLYDWVTSSTWLNNGWSYANPAQALLGQMNSWSLNGADGTYPGTYSLGYDVGLLDSRTEFKEGNGFFSWIADPVNTMSGEFYIDEVDLSLPGPMPLQVRRNYGSQNLAANQLGYGWKLNYMPYLSVAPSNNVIYAAEPSGSVLAFGLISTNLWAPAAALNPMLNNYADKGIGSVANYFNARLAKAAVGGTNYYYLTNGDGSLRVFQEMSFPLTNSTAWDRLRPYLTTWYDNRSNYYRFEYGTNVTQADYGQVRRIVSSSGNIVRFLYDVCGRVTDAYSLDGRRVQYDYDAHGDLRTVTLPDTSEINYEYQLSTWTTNSMTNVYSTHLIMKEIKPDGRVLKNEYDAQRRVTNQWATVGPDLRLVRNATFRYTNNFNLTNLTATLSGTTTILDYTNNPTVYFYTNGLIWRIVDPHGGQLVQEWYEANETNAPAYPRSLKTVTDKRGLVTSFLYDSRGNVTNTTVKGDLLGDGNTNTTAVSTALYNGNNLPSRTEDASGTTNLFFYTNTWLLARVETWPSNCTPAQAITNLYSYENVTNAADGTASFGLRMREVRAALSPDAATNEWAYNSRGFPTRLGRYTGTTDPAVIVTNFYNTRGELAVQTDAAGRKTAFSYDPRGSIQSREVFDTGQSIPLAWEYYYYNENGELTWSDGPRYNPEDYTWRDYDGAGRKSQEIHWRSQGRIDGSGVEAATGDNLYATTFYQFDSFGNMTRVTDPLGNFSLKNYDAVGQLLREEFYDSNGALLATNGLAYNLAGDATNAFNALGGSTQKQYSGTGKPKFQKNADGSTNGWLYYVDGRLRREIQNNGAYWETTYQDAPRKVTKVFYSATGTALATNVSEFDRRGNAVKNTDAGGNVFTNLYDGLDRLKVSAGPVIQCVSISFPELQPVTNFQQHVSTTFYDAAGVTVTNVNALGEKSIVLRDALGRVVNAQTWAANGASPLRVTTTDYEPNHHGYTVTEGTGGEAIITETWVDNSGKPVLTARSPDGYLLEYTWQKYDRNENAVENYRFSTEDGWMVYYWTYDLWTYDGLNRMVTETCRSNELTVYNRDPLGSVTNRVMPGGLQWHALYSSAGQMQREWITGSDGSGTRTNTYSYYPAGNAWAGLLRTNMDGLGITSTYLYDDWLRPATNIHSATDGNVSTAWSYDPRGLLTRVIEWNDDYYEQGTTVDRKYDAYSQMISERVNVPGLPATSAFQTWDVGGRRTQLGFGSFGYSFAWRADGLLAAVSSLAGNSSYGYDSAGVLTNRTAGNRVTSVTSRDGVGRPLTTVTKVNGATLLQEFMSYYDDGLLNTHVLLRPGFTDWRDYWYAADSRRLSQERFALDGSTRWTNHFAYDQGQAGGPGVLTRAGADGPNPANWTGGTDAFSRITAETNTVLQRPAFGRVNGQATITATLDGRSTPVMLVTPVGGGDPLWPQLWRTTMELTPGPHQLAVSAAHPSGFFTTNTSVWFTNNSAPERVAEHYDGKGQLTQRIWIGSNGATNRTQTLEWDALGRLAYVFELDSQTNGYSFMPVYDPLGRRVAVLTSVLNNDYWGWHRSFHYYDPLVEFLELGVSLDERPANWKLYGPDLNGSYGGMNGTGGLEGVADGVRPLEPVISDIRGNVLGSVSNGVVKWNEARPTGYGAAPAHRPLPLGYGANLAQSSAWRGRWVDITGYIYLGARYYDPVAGSFLGVDPVWNNRDPNYYSFCGGDPINYFDADGRLGKQWTDYSHQIDINNPLDFLQAVAYGIGGTALQTVGSVPGVFSQARADMTAANQEISTYTGAKAALANPLRVMGNFAFGTTALFNDPFNTVPQIPGAIAQLPDRMGENIYNFASSSSIYGAFNLGGDALTVGGLAYGAARGLTLSGVTVPAENVAAKTYLQITKGAEWESHYNSFTPGTARLNVTLGGQTLFRAADSPGSATYGEFASLERPSSPMAAIQGNALSPTVTGNQASQLFQVTTRPGFSLQGTAASQGVGYPGGFMQVFQTSRRDVGLPTWNSVAPIPYGGPR